MPKGTQKEYLTELLNKTEAMIDAGFGTITELATFLLPDQGRGQAATRVSEWIRSRVKRPNGETSLRMLEWAAQKTLAISEGGRPAETKYRKAFRDVETRRKS